MAGISDHVFVKVDLHVSVTDFKRAGGAATPFLPKVLAQLRRTGIALVKFDERLRPDRVNPPQVNIAPAYEGGHALYEQKVSHPCSTSLS